MLSVRLTNCRECALVSNLLDLIDCKLAEMANNLYLNIAYMLDKPAEACTMSSLLHYKRILTYKSCNADWAVDYSTDDIASKVNFLTGGCKCCGEGRSTGTSDITTTTTTTIAGPTTTTTSTTGIPVTTTTTTTFGIHFSMQITNSRTPNISGKGNQPGFGPVDLPLNKIDNGDGTWTVENFPGPVAVESFHHSGYADNGGDDYITSATLNQADYLTNFGSAFEKCPFLTDFTIHPSVDTSNVLSTSTMFKGCTLFNSPITIDMSSAYGIQSMFEDAVSFNSTLNAEFFFTSGVLDWSKVFKNAASFNQPVPFDTSSAEYMISMFEGAIAFNQSVSSFDTSGVRSMKYMFRDCDVFNQSVANFSTAAFGWQFVYGTSVEGMFYQCYDFNQNVNHFDLSNEINVSYFLSQATSFNNGGTELILDLGRATNVRSFLQATAIEKVGNLVSPLCSDFAYMFNNATAVECIRGLNTSLPGAIKTAMFSNNPALVNPTPAEVTDLMDSNGAIHSFACITTTTTTTAAPTTTTTTTV